MPPQYPDFPKKEFEHRYARARALMEEENLDALLITERLNYIYFTGHRSVQNFIDKIRPYIYILPKNDEGVLITMPFEVDQVLETTWVTDIRKAGLMDNAGFITSVLKDKGLSSARIGAELGREQFLGINYNDFMKIQQAIPNAEFVDASTIFLKLRAVKSTREIEYIRCAAEIAATAEAETYDAVRIGMTEIEIERMLRARVAELGAERVTEMVVTAGLGPKGGIVLLPTDRKVQPGDLLGLDVGVEYRGYCSDIARTASVGEPTDEVAEFYCWVMEVRKKCIDLLLAGKTPCDVVTACIEAIQERELETMGVGRIGHGVGLETTEYPSLALEEEVIFEPGMVFACNPNFVRPFGFVNAEDNWAITDDDPELLSAPIAPDEIPVILS